MSTLMRVEAKELRARREAILDQLGMTAKEIRRRAEEYILTSEQRRLVDELQGIDFLLGNDEVQYC